MQKWSSMRNYALLLLPLVLHGMVQSAERDANLITIVSSDNIEFVVNKPLFLKHSKTFKELYQWPDGIIVPYKSLFNAEVVSTVLAATKLISDQEKKLACQPEQLVFYPFKYVRSALDQLLQLRIQDIVNKKNNVYTQEEEYITDLMHASLFFDIPELSKYLAYVIAQKAHDKNYTSVDEAILNAMKIKNISEHGLSLINKQLALRKNNLVEYTVADYLVEYGQPPFLTISQGKNKPLVQLNLANKALTSLFGLNCIENAHKITTINLSNNKIVKIERDQFSAFTDLQSINLDNNIIEAIPAFAFVGCKQVQHLSLGYNRIAHVYPDAFWGLEHLLSLDLKRNLISYIAQYMFFDCKKLQRLWLEYNNITEIKRGAFDDLADLSFLNLIANKITRLPEDIFKKNLRLRDIYLMGNELQRFSPELIADLQLQTLNLSYNQLSDLNVQELQSIPNVTVKILSPQKE